MEFFVLLGLAVVLWLLISPFLVFSLMSRVGELEESVKWLKNRIAASIRDDITIKQSDLVAQSRPQIPLRSEALDGRPSAETKPRMAVTARTDVPKEHEVAPKSEPLQTKIGSMAASDSAEPTELSLPRVTNSAASLADAAPPIPQRVEDVPRVSTPAVDKVVVPRVASEIVAAADSRRLRADQQVESKPMPARTPTSPDAHQPVRPISTEVPFSLEELLAGKWLTWVGALAVIIGVGFGFKYAVDNGWLDPSRRVLLGMVVGLIGFACGAIAMRRDYRFPGQGLTGASMGVLYMSCFAAHVWYDLISYEVAFLGMAVTTAGGLIFAARFDSQPTAFLGLLGGFLTPAMLHHTGVNPFGVLAPYLLLLDAGVVYVSTQRRWLGLQNLAFCGTCLAGLTWYFGFYESSMLALVIAFLSVFFVLFAMIGVMQNVVRQVPAVAGDFFLILATPCVVYGALYGLTYVSHPNWQGALALMMASIYGYLAVLNAQINPNGKSVAAALAGLAGTFLIIAAPVQLTGHWVTIAWIAESVMLVEIGLRYREKTLTLTGLSLLAKVQFILMIYAFGTFADPAGFQTAFVRQRFDWIGSGSAIEPSWMNVFNGRSFSYLVDVLGMAWLAFRCGRRAKEDGGDNLIGMTPRSLQLWLAAGVPLIGLMLAITETFVWGMLRHWHGLTILNGFTIWAAIAGTGLVAWSLFIGPRPLERLGWCLLGLMSVGVLLGIGGTCLGLVFAGGSRAYWAAHWWLLNPGGMSMVSAATALALTAFWYALDGSRPSLELDDVGRQHRAETNSLNPTFTVLAFLAALAAVLQETFAWGIVHEWHGITIVSSLTMWTALLAAITVGWAAIVGPQSTAWLGRLLFIPTIAGLVLGGLWTIVGMVAQGADKSYWFDHWWLLNPGGLGFVTVIAALMVTQMFEQILAAQEREGERYDPSAKMITTLSNVFGSTGFFVALTMVLQETFAWGAVRDWTSVSMLSAFVAWTALFGAGLATWRFIRKSIGLDRLLVGTFVLLGTFVALNAVATLYRADQGAVSTTMRLAHATGGVFEQEVVDVPSDWWLLNPRGLSSLLAIVVTSLTAWFEQRRRSSQSLSNPPAKAVLSLCEAFALAACFAGLLTVLLETAAWGIPRDWRVGTLASSLAIGAAPFALGLAVWTARFRRGVMNGFVITQYAILGALLLLAGVAGLSRDSVLPGNSLVEPEVTLWLFHPRGAAFLIGIVSAGLASLCYLRSMTHDGGEAEVDHGDQASLDWLADAGLHSRVLGLSSWFAGLAMFTIEAVAQGAARQWQTETSLAITLTWTTFALGTLVAGIFWRSGTVRVLALSIFVLTVAKVFLLDVWHLETVIRVFAFISLGGTLLLVSFLYRHYRDRIRSWIAPE